MLQSPMWLNIRMTELEKSVEELEADEFWSGLSEEVKRIRTGSVLSESTYAEERNSTPITAKNVGETALRFARAFRSRV